MYQVLIVVPVLKLGQAVLEQVLDGGVLAYLGVRGFWGIQVGISRVAVPLYRGVLMVHVLAGLIMGAVVLGVNIVA